MKLLGIVARTRVNPADSGRPAVELEYVHSRLPMAPEQRIPSVVWTTARAEALPMSWDDAQDLARAIGFPAHAVTVSSTDRVAQARRSPAPSVSPSEAFERLAERGLA